MIFVSKRLFEEYVYEVSRSDAGGCHVQTLILISSIVNKFKEKNKAWSKTMVIMSDKDFTESESFGSCSLILSC